MDISDFDILGFYDPGFLHMRVNTDEELKDLNALAADPKTAKYFSTFFHEYIHFLQDITTSSGLIRTIHLIDVLQEYIHEVKNDGEAEFFTPLVLTNKSNMDANNLVQSYYYANEQPINYVRYSHYTIEYAPVADKDSTVFQVARYKIHYFSRSGQAGTFYFGSVCLKEYVAHTLQTKYAPETEHDDMPYKIAGLIIEKEFPELGSDSMMITALCDASLLSLHPAQMFFNLINAMKAQQFVPADAMEIYNFMHENFTFDGPAGKFNVDGLIDHQVSKAIHQLNDALKSDIFEPNRRWVNHMLVEAYTLRKEIPDFMTRLVDSAGKLSPLFFTIFHRMGSPFFTNSKGSGGFVPPRGFEAEGIQPYQLLVFREIVRVFLGQRSCGMYSFCKSHSQQDITNADCLTSPWKRGVADDLCPFGQFWKTWGLNGEIPVAL